MEGKVSHFLVKNSNKLGIDLDSPTRLQLLRSYFNAKYMFPDKEIKVFRSSGGDGYHIEIWGVKSTLSIRRTLGDCIDRMMYSEIRSMTKDNKEEFVFDNPYVDDVMFAIKTRKVKRYKTGEVIVKRQMRIEIDQRSLIAQDFW